MLKSVSFVAALALVAGTVLAQEAAKEQPKAAAPEVTTETTTETKVEPKVLKAGDQAPAIQVEKFIKGDPVTGYEKGKVYVVEFWATWCGPCVQSMPHISSIQKEYKDKGLTIVGVNVREEENYTSETLKNVEKFVAEKGDKMGYTIAYDGSAKKMGETFMDAAQQRGIPTCFVIDGAGKIAWIGHPIMLDEIIPSVIAGNYTIEGLQASEKALNDALDEISKKAQSDDPKSALAAWDQFEKEHPGSAKAFEDYVKPSLYMQTKEFAKLYAYLNVKADEAITEKDTDTLHGIAWQLSSPQLNLENPDLALALKAAEKANEFSEGKEAGILDTLARVYWLKGDKAKALETQTKAVDLASKDEKYARMMGQLNERLAEYSKK